MFHLDFKHPVPFSTPHSGGLHRVSWQGCMVMGILNITPDSFSDGGKHFDPHHALQSAQNMLAAGAKIIDIGGESTRPNATPVSTEEQLARVIPVIQAIHHLPVLISIDTQKPEVAEAALKAGAHIVNDITGLTQPQMLNVCAQQGAPAIIMHMQGTPQTMQQNPRYTDIVSEVQNFLYTQAEKARAAGVPSVLIDVGIGFGKTLEHNLTLLKHLHQFNRYPVLLGASRKKLIDTLAGAPEPSQRDSGSIALHLFGIEQGAAIIRVHDVAGHMQAIKVWQTLKA